MVPMLSFLAWTLGTIAALAFGLGLGVWAMGHQRKRNKGGGSWVAMVDFGFNSRELAVMQESRAETERKKPSRPGDPPTPD
jgi:hypothetical protein